MELPALFPYEDLRRGQRSLVRHITKSLDQGKPLLAHAPTGLGKTVAALAPALELARQKNLTVFFLTSRHTQHRIALDTIEEINKRHDLRTLALSIVGKQWMCLQPGVHNLRSGEFSELCRRLREDKQCTYYQQARKSDGGATTETSHAVSGLKVQSPLRAPRFLQDGERQGLCPYELALETAKEARVIVTDYYYLFSPSIRERFLQKIGKQLDQSILIVDEGHNLPNRLRNLFSATLSTSALITARKEVERYGYEDLLPTLTSLQDVLVRLGQGMQDERAVTKGEFMKALESIGSYTALLSQLEEAGEAVQKQQQRSALVGIAQFLESWAGPDTGYARILSRRRGARAESLHLQYKCLDPSLIAEPVIKESYWTLLMSGTLNPPEMYRDLLGFDVSAEIQEYASPFAAQNRLALVIPETTTKYSARNEVQYQQIAQHLLTIIDKVPGNTAVFFPSYQLRDLIYKHLMTACPRTIFREDPSLTKSAREELLERFKSYKDTGAVLLGVAAGSFGEGVDLPGDLLKCVIIVGLPLGRPDLETKELIAYYDHKFGQGWNYGYILPAFSKTLQNAGRCIRSEDDRGAVIFLDERYAWPRYLQCFPEDWDVEVTPHYADRLSQFFQP